jgi:DNA gyrase subunit A
VRRARAEDSIIIGSRRGMAIHFRADNQQLRPLGRATRGVRAMSLRAGDELVGMDILPGLITANLEEQGEDEADLDLVVDESSAEAVIEEPTAQGPWVLVITTHGFGKRVPVSQFRLQNRAGKGLTSTKFKSTQPPDQVTALRIVNPDEELMLVTTRGIIIRQAINAISSQSRAATGVRVQRLDEDDAIAAVAVVPALEAEETDDNTEADSAELVDPTEQL